MLRPSLTTKILATAALPFIAGAITLFWLAELRHVEPHLAPAGPTVQRQYAGNADLYRYSDSPNGPIPPTFATYVITRDSSEMIRHLRNTAARRHWVKFDNGGYYRHSYILPDYDIEIVREIARNPYEWALKPEQQSSDYAPNPDPGDMMKAVILIRTYQPSSAFLAGTIVAAIFATVLTCATSGVYLADITRNRRM